MMIWYFACLMMFTSNVSLFGLIDLEQYSQEIVVDIQKIEIPNHPYAFNPSILRWQGKLLMSFREIIEPCTSLMGSAGDSIIGLIWLDDDFQPLSDAYILDTGKSPSCAEDARLVQVGEEIYIVYSDNIEDFLTEGGFRMFSAKLIFHGHHFELKDKQRLTYFDGENPLRREKNWSPFDYQGALHLIYSIMPHTIFQPFEGTECCKTIASTQANLRWPWGEMRGSTPAIHIGERYLVFFHSSIYMSSVHSQGESIPHYFIGAYLFSEEPPFAITHISPKPIITNGFYSGLSYPYYWKPICAIFPCGILVEDKTVWISYGRQDHEIWMAKIDKEALLKTLKPVHD